jgi:hypothetical protein
MLKDPYDENLRIALFLLRPFRKINDPLVGPAFRERATGVFDDETVAGPFPECGWILIFLE